MLMVRYRQPPPSKRESKIARTAKQLLSRYDGQDQPLTLHMIDTEHDKPIELPAGAVALLMEILETMADGQGITLISENAELVTVQATNVVNISQPFPGMGIEDVTKYQRDIDQEREAMLDQLVADAQTQNLGYH
jgi:hypothetical protein